MDDSINFSFTKEKARGEYFKMGGHVFMCAKHLALKGLGEDIKKFYEQLKQCGLTWNDCFSWIVEEMKDDKEATEFVKKDIFSKNIKKLFEDEVSHG